MHERAGLKARESDLINIDELLEAFTKLTPNPEISSQRVAFGTSGHRGSSLKTSFNEAHIVAMSRAIAEYRKKAGIEGPLFLGADTHALSLPAQKVAIEVLMAAGVQVLVSAGSGDALFVPTPAISNAILKHNAGMNDNDRARADGIVITPSHNPPQDGGFKYNPPHGGPADTDATNWIAARANELLSSFQSVERSTEKPHTFDFLDSYVAGLTKVINMDAIREAGIRFAVHPLGGSSLAYWDAIRDRYDLDLTVLGPGADPQWGFMHLDWDGKVRMDPSSPHSMATVAEHSKDFALIVANDADADRHGIVTGDAGLMNPNHFLAVAIDYLLTHRPAWSQGSNIGKTLVSSAIIDRVVASHGRNLLEVPVGFKWFVPGLSDGTLVFGGEESAGASMLCFDGSPWSTDKDGIILALLAAEIYAVTGKSPSELYEELTQKFGAPTYSRVDAAASPEDKAKLAKLSAADVTTKELAGEPIAAVLTHAPGNGAPIGGIKVVTENAWFAARPSGTEDVMKVYAESFNGPEHLQMVLAAAQDLVQTALTGE